MDTANNRVIIRMAVKMSDNTVLASLANDAGSPALSDVSIAALGQNVSVADMVITGTVGNGSYTFMVHSDLYGLDYYRTVDIDSFHTVTYDGNGYTGGAVPADTMSYVEGYALTLPVERHIIGGTFTLTKTDAVWIGWSPTQSAVLTSQADEDNLGLSDTYTIPDQNSRLFAVWAEDLNHNDIPDYKEGRFTVVYDRNGATGGRSPASLVDILEGDPTALSVTGGTLSMPGYHFAGWSATAAPNKLAADDPARLITSVTADASDFGPTDSWVYRVYAVWVANTYTVTYDPGAGMGTMTDQSATYDQSLTLFANTFTRTGYHFVGWDTDGDTDTVEYADAMAFTYQYVGNLDLVATWVADTYTISYAGLGASSFDPTNPNPTAYTVEDTFPIAIDNEPTKAGYTFEGWVAEYADGTVTDVTKPYGIPAGTTGDIALTAVWSLNDYNITYEYDGGTAPATANPTDYNVEDTFPIAIDNEPTKAGYAFEGWTVDYADAALTDITTATKPYSISAGTTGDIALTAVWSPVVYTVSYAGLTGVMTQPTPKPTNYTVEDTFPIAIGNPTKTGYTFTGWTVDYANPALTDVTTPTTVYSVPASTTGDIALTANWSPVAYTVSYAGLTGVTTQPTPKPTSYTVEDTFPIAVGNPTKIGYTFTGWTVDYANPSLTDVTTPLLTYSIPANTTGDVALTANWSLDDYNITYDYDRGTAPATANPTGYNVEDTFPIAIDN
ncbi:MAG: InlB B-repeat-containing protein [Lachnospiraceae bacterium]